MRALRGAIVGYGFIAEHGHLPAYRDRGPDARPFDIVAVADVCEARREQARRALPNARIYESHLDLIANERGRIDFVDITTPPRDHAAIAIAALDAGLHVLCEKPLATRAEDARAVLARARAERRVVYPCHNYKHAPVVAAARRVLSRGDIGAVHLVTLDTFRTTHARGVAEWRPDWRRDRHLAGGGIAMDHGAHTLYLALSWMGAPASTISAHMSTRRPHDTEDGFSCRVAFPTGEAQARLTWNAGVRKVIYTLHGSLGAIRIEDDEIEIAKLVDGGRRVLSRERVASEWMDASHVHWFQPLQNDFAAAIDRGDFVGAEAETALACVELIAAAYASAKNGSREVAVRGPSAPAQAPAFSTEHAS